RRHRELREEPAVHGVVVLQEGLVGDLGAIVLDRLERRAPDVAGAPRERLPDALPDLGEAVERAIGHLRDLEPLAEHLARETRAYGADPGFTISRRGGPGVGKFRVIHRPTSSGVRGRVQASY